MSSFDDIQHIPGNLCFPPMTLSLLYPFPGPPLAPFRFKVQKQHVLQLFPLSLVLFSLQWYLAPKIFSNVTPFLLIPDSGDTLQLFLGCVLCSIPSFYFPWPLIFSTFFQRKLLMFYCWFFNVLLFYVHLPVLICFFCMPVQHVQALVPLVVWLFASTTHKNITLASTRASVLWGC